MSEPHSAIEAVENLFYFRNMPETLDEISSSLSALGLTFADAESNPDLLFEAGIARNIRRACEALNIPVTPHQSLTLAKHRRVGADHYRNGVPLSAPERSIALKLEEIYWRAFCQKKGVALTDEMARDYERRVRFGERGLHIGHKIGEASGCFQLVLFAVGSGLCLLLLLFWA